MRDERGRTCGFDRARKGQGGCESGESDTCLKIQKE